MNADAQTLLDCARQARHRGDRATSLKHLYAASVLDPKQAAIKVEIAADLRDLDRLAEAETMLQDVVTQNPQHFGALVGLAHIARKRGDRRTSLSYFEAAAAVDPSQVSAKMEIVWDLRDLGRLDEAEPLLRSILAQQPDHSAALTTLGHLLRRRGDRLASVDYFQAALQSAPQLTSLKLEVALDLRELSRTDEAVAIYRSILDEQPNHFGALVGLGHLARRRGSRLASLEHFQAALAADPGQRAVKLEIAYDLRELSRFDEAETVLLSILEEQPVHFGALTALGHLARRRGNRSASLAYFEAARDADPSQSSVMVEIASDLRAIGKISEAEQVLLNLVEQQPKNHRALVALAQIARQRGDQAAALSYLEAARDVTPNHADDRLALAAEFRDLFRFDTAEQICQQVLKEAPGHSTALVELGLVARRQGKRTEALEHFRYATQAPVRNGRAYLELATELRDRGLYEEALQTIETLIQLEPGNIHAQMQRGYIWRQAGNREAARGAFRAIAENNAGFAQAFVELAVEERALGNLSQAEALLEQVLNTRPDYLWALEQRAESARLVGDLEKALTLLRQAIAAHPGSMWPYIHASQVLDDLGEHADAHELLDRATAHFGAQPEIICKRGELLKRAGHLHAARRLLEDARRGRPQNFPLWSHCIQLDIFFGDFDAAASKLDGFSTEVVTERSRVHLFQGQLAEAQGRIGEARHHYDLALQLSPNDLWTRAEMVRACLLSLKIDEARTHLEEWTRLNSSFARPRGGSLNVSQSHMGQIFDEFVLNRPLLDQLTKIQELTPADRIEPLRALVRLNPDYSPGAIQLLAALREANLIHRDHPTAPVEGPHQIPRSIIQYWDSPEPPDDVQELMQSWRDHNPGYAYRLFDDAAARQFLEQTYSRDVLTAYRRAEGPAEKADLFRLAYLYAQGGIYADADDRCLGSISQLLPVSASLVVYREDYALGGLSVGTLGNNFIAATPQHPVIERALTLATQAINRGDTDVVWLKTGPALMTRAFAQTFAETLLKPAAWLGKSVVLERSTLSQVCAIHCFTAYKKTKQHWRNTEKGAVVRR